MTSRLPEKPSDRPPDALAAFREEARAILATSGGMNALSLAKVRVLGQKFGLSDRQVADVMAGIGAAPKARSPQIEAFQTELHRRLKTVEVISPAIVAKLERFGQSKFRLQVSDASDAVRRVIRDRGLRVITPEAAEAAFRKQLDMMFEAGPLTPAHLKALKANAAALGLSTARARALFREEKRESQSRRPAIVRAKNSRFLFVTIGFAAGTLLTFFLAVSYFRLGPGVSNRPQARSTPSPATPNAPAEPKVANASASAAWTAAVAEARRAFPNESDQVLFESLVSPSESERVGALRSLLLRLTRYLDRPDHREVVGRLLASGLAAESSASAVRQIRDELLSALSAPLAAGTLGAEPLDRGFWALDVALNALADPSLDAPRAADLAEDLKPILLAGGLPDDAATALRQAIDGLHANPSNAADVSSRCRAQLCERYYRALIDRVAVHVRSPALLEAHQTIAAQAEQLLPADRREPLETDFLAVALESAGPAWKRYQPLLDNMLRSGTRDHVRKILDLYLKTSNADLRDHLDALLRSLVPGGTDISDPAQLAEAFRTRVRPTGSRWDLFRTRAEQALANAGDGSGPPDEVLKSLVELATTSALGCALAQGGSGDSTFDELLKGPPSPPRGPDSRQAPVLPPALANAPPAMPNNPFLMPFGQGGAVGLPNNVEDLIRQLAIDDELQRLAAIQAILRAGLPDDLARDLGTTLAEYLLWAGKSNAESNTVNSGLTVLTQPRSVRLAMADLLGQVTPAPGRSYRLIDRAEFEPILTAITGQKSSPRIGMFSWREDARRALLNSVLLDLEGNLDDRAQTYRELYKWQGRLLGMPDSETLLTPQPSQMLEVVINHFGGRLNSDRARLSEADRARLERLPYEITAVDYLASDDLERTALLQRVWLRLLAIHVASAVPGRAADARAIVDEASIGASRPTSVLGQLLAGEKQAVTLWLLRNRPD